MNAIKTDEKDATNQPEDSPVAKVPELQDNAPQEDLSGFVSIEDIISEVRPHIPGPLNKDIINAARYAAITFCRNSGAIWKCLDLHRVDPGAENAVILDYPSPVRPLRIVSVTSRGIPLYTTQHWRMTQTRGYTTALVFNAAHPDVHIRYTLIPASGATLIPASLLDIWGDALVHGTLSELYIIPGKTWSNAGMSQYHRSRFTEGWRDAYRHTLDAFPVSGGSPPPYFGAAF